MAIAAPTSSAEPAWKASAAFVVMMAAQSVSGLIFAVPPPVLPLLAREFGSNGAFVAQMVIALSSFGMMAGALVSGWVVERGGVRQTIVASLVGFGLLGSGVLVVHSVWLLLGSRLLLGVVAAFITTACTVLITDTYHGSARSRVMGYQTGVGSALSVVCILAAGGMAQSLGWRAPFGIYAVFAAVVLALALASVPATQPQPAAETPAGGHGFLRLWPLYLTAAFLFVFAIGIGAQLPFLLQDHNVTSPVIQATIIGALTVFNSLASFAFGRIQAAVGARWTFGLGLMALGAGFVVIGVFPGAWAAGIGASLTGLGMGFFIPQLWVRASELAPEAVRGRALGFLNAVMFFGGFVSPFIFNPLHDLLGLAGAFIALGGAVLAGAVAVVIFRPKMLVSD